MKRKLFGIFLVLTALIFPWWVSLTLVFFGALYFENLYEAIVAGLILDLLYGINIEVYGFNLFFTLATTIMLYLFSSLRKRILI